MPLLLILAFVLAAYAVSPIDPVTLRATRFAAGAIGSTIRPTRSGGSRAGRGATRSGGRSTGPRSGRTRIEGGRIGSGSDRPVSRIAAAIRGGIRSADRAETRRGEALAAIRELLERRRQRRQARQIRQAEDAAHDENDRRDRAAARDRISDGAAAVADQYPEPERPVPPAPTPNGASVATPDMTTIPTTELQTLDDLLGEVRAVRALAEQIEEAAKPLVDFLHQFSERIKGASDLPKTPHMEASFVVISEIHAGPMEYTAQAVKEKWGWLESAIVAEQNRLKEIGPSTGRLENVAS
jgi:hypothetical protein